MTSLDSDALADVIAQVVKAHTEPLIARIKELETRQPMVIHGRDGQPGVPGPPGRDGERGEKGLVGDRGDVGPVGPSGPSGERGESGEKGEVGERGERGAEGPAGQPGAQGEKGEPGERGPEGPTGPTGDRGEKGMDGVGISDVFIDREGQLVASFGDGRTKTIGPVVGKDGRDGIDGQHGISLGIEHLEPEATFDPETRRMTWTFRSGDVVRQVHCVVPQPLYRGVYTEGRMYEPSDMVQWGGNIYLAQKQTDAKPGRDDTSTSGPWRLLVPRGREGKQGPQGPAGKPPEPVKVGR